MAKTLEFNMSVTAKDTVNISGNSNGFGFGDLVLSAPVVDAVAVNMVLPQGTTGANIFPRFADPGTNVFFVLFFKYAVDADRALGVELEADTGNTVTCADGFMGSATTTLGITNNANNDVTIIGCYYQL